MERPEPNLSNRTESHVPSIAVCSNATVDSSGLCCTIYAEYSALLIFRHLHVHQQGHGTPMVECCPLVPLKNNAAEIDCWCSRPGSH